MNDIILTGPKHSGKTRAGKILASLRQCEFVDLDELISKRTGKSPRQLFCEGSDVFKKAEAEAAQALCGASAQKRVIAAGGGIIDNPEAVNALKKLDAVIICLNISAESAWQRISSSADGQLPPFLQTENPQETHRSLHERRSAAYLAFADVIIEAEGKTSENIAKEIYNGVQ